MKEEDDCNLEFRRLDPSSGDVQGLTYLGVRHVFRVTETGEQLVWPRGDLQLTVVPDDVNEAAVNLLERSKYSVIREIEAHGVLEKLHTRAVEVPALTLGSVDGAQDGLVEALRAAKEA